MLILNGASGVSLEAAKMTTAKKPRASTSEWSVCVCGAKWIGVTLEEERMMGMCLENELWIGNDESFQAAPLSHSLSIQKNEVFFSGGCDHKSE